jgi:hypothetical protein
VLVGGQVELERMAPADVAEPADLDTALDELPAARTCRLGDDLEDQGQQGPRVVRRGEGVADQRQCLAGVSVRAMDAAAVAMRLRARSGLPARRAQDRQEQPDREQGRQDGADEQGRTLAPGEGKWDYIPQFEAIVALSARPWWTERPE